MNHDNNDTDLVYLEIGTDAEYEMGFNFLEIPLADPDPESQAFESAVSALAANFEPLLTQSGGNDWGPRMSGITRAIVRGLAEYQVRTDEDKTVTMLDMAFLLADEEGRQRIHEMMSEERIEWVQQATHAIPEYSEDDLEPLVRRLWEWVYSRAVRSIVSYPETTVSIDDIVREGRTLVVESGVIADAERQLITPALVRRVWLSIQEQTNSDEYPDPPQFSIVCHDEYSRIVSGGANLGPIFNEARSFGLSLTFGDEFGMYDGIPESAQKVTQDDSLPFLTVYPRDESDAQNADVSNIAHTTLE